MDSASSANESAENSLPDRATVAFRPPVMLGTLLLMGFGLRALVPCSFASERLASLVGPIIFASALALFLWAVFTMRSGGGSLPTNKPTDVIVSGGPYRFSRNPVYLAMVTLLVGVGLWANSLWFIGMAALDAILLSRGVIAREEEYLDRKFGDSYASYKSRVRRWL